MSLTMLQQRGSKKFFGKDLNATCKNLKVIYTPALASEAK